MSWRYEADHEYEARSGEFVFDDYGHRDIENKRLDLDADPPVLVDDPPEPFARPGVVNTETQELIADLYREAGTDAIAAHDAMDANANIPQEVVDRSDAGLRMFYLLYVSLTGNRIQSFEDRFFP